MAEVVGDAAERRHKKSIDRGLAWLDMGLAARERGDITSQTLIFGGVGGGWTERERERAAAGRCLHSRAHRPTRRVECDAKAAAAWIAVGTAHAGMGVTPKNRCPQFVRRDPGLCRSGETSSGWICGKWNRVGGEPGGAGGVAVADVEAAGRCEASAGDRPGHSGRGERSPHLCASRERACCHVEDGADALGAWLGFGCQLHGGSDGGVGPPVRRTRHRHV